MRPLAELKVHYGQLLMSMPVPGFMAALSFIDLITLFDEPTPKELIEAVRPDILVKGDDYTVDTIVGADFVLANGGSVQTVALVKGYSTTALIDRIKNSF